MRNKTVETENPAPGPRGASKNDLLDGSVANNDTANSTPAQAVHDYVLAELRIAALHARIMVNEVDSIGHAYKAGIMSGDMAIEYLLEIGAPVSMKVHPSQGGPR